MTNKAHTARRTGACASASLPTGAHATPALLARRLAAAWPARARATGPAAILDPACGEGELLLAAWEAAGRSAELAARGLHGIELDPALCARARGRLRAAIGGEAGARAAANVRCADALDPAVAWTPGTFLLANPPWASLSGRQSRGVAAEVTGADGAIGSASRRGGGWPSLHGAFLARIARHVGEERTGARVLLPASVAELDGYGPLRAAVGDVARLARPPEDLGEGAFPGVVGRAIWIELAPRDAEEPGGSPAPWTRADGAAAELAAALERHPRLAPQAFGDPGVHTGNAAAALVVRLRADAPDEARLAGLREGRDLTAFHLGAPRAWLRTDLVPSAERRFRRKELALYRAVPVLVRQTADRPVAALHTAPAAFRNSLLACRPPGTLDPAFAVGVLNSSLAAAWHRARHADARQRAFPQVKVAHLRGLPFPFAARGEAPALHDEVLLRVRRMAVEGFEDALAREVDRLVLEAYRLPAGLAARVEALAAGRAAGSRPWS